MTETEKLCAEIDEYEEQRAKYKNQIKSIRQELKERGFDLEVVDNLVRKKLIEKGYTWCPMAWEPDEPDDDQTTNK